MSSILATAWILIINVNMTSRLSQEWYKKVFNRSALKLILTQEQYRKRQLNFIKTPIKERKKENLHYTYQKSTTQKLKWLTKTDANGEVR